MKNPLTEKHPLIEQMADSRAVFWRNDHYSAFQPNPSGALLKKEDIMEADRRLRRFAPFIEAAFPETEAQSGIIESPLVQADDMKEYLGTRYGVAIDGTLHIKSDDSLTVSGSVKARGGIYEVLKYAEDLALEHGMIDSDDDYGQFDTEKFRHFFSDYTIICGSTGNLGLSIGIIGAALGFKVVIHMSSDAKQWKKDMLGRNGVMVVEHEDDYSKAVEKGREEALADDKSYFVDDEDSEPLFLGYAVAALRLERQLEKKGIRVDASHPLYVYLPCGVGSAPGGISFGLKHVFGDAVHPVFAEPVHSPCMLLGLMTGMHDGVSVRDIGLDNRTVADGLAVGRPSKFAGKLLADDIHSLYTVQDDEMYTLLAACYDREHMKIEPSAAAGLPGPAILHRNIDRSEIRSATHIIWSTGGSMVPDEEWQEDYRKGKG
ncbi:D-serine ammonia-lyase [Salinicoccus bachuensis]|uniref:Probable D-serine dehydratase n=1 Tax=Salinicoccus bachuensis TaxID=3136731 RepID=A0ABZ3CFT5_9STAP